MNITVFIYTILTSLIAPTVIIQAIYVITFDQIVHQILTFIFRGWTLNFTIDQALLHLLATAFD